MQAFAVEEAPAQDSKTVCPGRRELSNNSLHPDNSTLLRTTDYSCDDDIQHLSLPT